MPSLAKDGFTTFFNLFRRFNPAINAPSHSIIFSSADNVPTEPVPLSIVVALSPIIRSCLPEHAEYLPTCRIIFPQSNIQDLKLLVQFIKTGFLEGSLFTLSNILHLLQLIGVDTGNVDIIDASPKINTNYTSLFSTIPPVVLLKSRASMSATFAVMLSDLPPSSATT